jgi:hypothetical protein
VLWLELRIDPQPDRRTVEITTADHVLSQVLETALREMISKG